MLINRKKIRVYEEHYEASIKMTYDLNVGMNSKRSMKKNRNVLALYLKVVGIRCWSS